MNMRALTLLLSFTLLAADASSAKKPATSTNRLESPEGLEAVNARLQAVTYRGRHAIQLLPMPGHENSDEELLAIVANSGFRDGTIEVDVAGAPSAGAAPDMRGFIGIAFRVQGDGARYESIYLRPTNGRVEDQVRRNRSVQYMSVPDFPWKRLREESPGAYESYVDLEPGAWTKIKVVVSGRKACLYVNGASQPCLVVNDLKLGETKGRIALWGHGTTDGYFSGLRVTGAP